MTITYRQVWRVCLAVGLFVGLLYLAWQARPVLGWIAAAFFFAVALTPIVDLASHYMPRKSRGLATGVVFIAMLAIIGFIIYSLIPPLIQQTQSLVRNLPNYVQSVQNGHGTISDIVHRLDLVNRLQQQESHWLSTLSSAGGSLAGVARGLFDSIISTISILSLTYFMITEGPAWMKRFWSVQRPERREHYQHLAGEMYKVMNGYVTGNLIAAAIIAILTAVILTVVGVPYAIPLGLLTGIFDIVPIIGAFAGAIIVCVAAAFTSLTAGIIMIIFFVVYGQIETHALRPLVFGRSVSMSPLIVIMSILIGTAVDGVFGALISIPVAACLQILIKDWLTIHRPAESA